jgi:LmbE family N-acetylglucosaminyl deacetylase
LSDIEGCLTVRSGESNRTTLATLQAHPPTRSLAHPRALLDIPAMRFVTRLARSVPTLATFALAAACASPSVSPAPAPSASGKTLVAVFAHPDDETIVAPALAHAARNGATVYLVVATDGRRGVSQHAGIPAGDSLAKVRAAEARCSAAALGARPPVMLGFEDAGLSVLSPWPGEPLDRMEKRIDSTLHALRPDVVLSWGPEGGYGHQDHRLVGDVVTQVFQKGELGSARLLYVGFTADRIAGAPRWYGSRVYPTAQAFLTTRIAFDEQDHEAARRAIACHKSQATEAGMTESYTALTHLWNGVVAFQQWRGGPVTSSFF